MYNGSEKFFVMVRLNVLILDPDTTVLMTIVFSHSLIVACEQGKAPLTAPRLHVGLPKTSSFLKYRHRWSLWWSGSSLLGVFMNWGRCGWSINILVAGKEISAWFIAILVWLGETVSSKCKVSDWGKYTIPFSMPWWWHKQVKVLDMGYLGSSNATMDGWTMCISHLQKVLPVFCAGNFVLWGSLIDRPNIYQARWTDSRHIEKKGLPFSNAGFEGSMQDELAPPWLFLP